jgi:hypothetical protein
MDNTGLPSFPFAMTFVSKFIQIVLALTPGMASALTGHASASEFSAPRDSVVSPSSALAGEGAGSESGSMPGQGAGSASGSLAADPDASDAGRGPAFVGRGIPGLAQSALSFHAGWHGYREPALGMRLDGPLVGFRVQWAPRPLQGGEVDFEAEVGVVDYRSRDSGFMDGSPRFRTSTALLMGALATSLWPRPGLALTTEWTDLRGLTSTGSPGYERFNRSIWLVGQWRVPPLSLPERPAILQAGILLSGWHDSYLSQAGDYGDVTNRQTRGFALALDAPWAFEGWRGSLGLRVQRYADSDLQLSPRLGQVYEPANRSFDIRLSVHY